jgi:RNA-binding protein 39
VKPSEAEKNFVARKDPVPLDGGKGVPDTRVYVGNIHVSITDVGLRSILEQFGPVESVTLHRDELGNSKGFAFVRFVNADSAKLAMSSLGGLELAGRPLKVGPVIDGSQQKSSSAIDVSSAGASANWKLDDDDGITGMQLNANSRVMLMAKLGQAAGMKVPVPTAQPPPMPFGSNPLLGAAGIAQDNGVPPITGTISSYLMIRNMFDLEAETEENWHEDVKEDVVEECSRHGQVLRCIVDRKRPGGLVYLQFGSAEVASKAAANLHGRFFAGRMITVMYLDAGQFSAFLNA